MNSKLEWRQILQEKRKAISSQRRVEAALLLKEKLSHRGCVLSFTTIGSEIDTSLLNQLLAKEQRLFLVPYRLDSFTNAPISQIDCILVPGLGFDKEGYRLGYGQGYYDRFLATTGTIPTIGIGFKEQFIDALLPRDPWDIPVTELLLV